MFDLTQQRYLMTKTHKGVTSFAYSAGILVVIRNNRLGWYENGEIKDRIALPLKGMQVAAGKMDRLYLYGWRSKGNIVYLMEEGKILPIINIPKGRISAFTSIGERIFFAIDNMIYTMAKGEKAGLLFIASGEKQIRSLAPDPISGVLYFSAGETVYAVHAGVAISILKGLEGTLRYSGNALFVFDPKKRRLVKVTGLEKLTGEAGEKGVPAQTGGFKE